MLCSRQPDPRVVSDMNTYLQLWEENENVELESVAQEFVEALSVLSELESHLYSSLSSSEEDRNSLIVFKGRIRDAIRQKLDAVTANILQYADQYASQKLECQKFLEAAGMKFGIWVNLAKNPRIKAIEYPELAISFDLPKSLTTSSVAIRTFELEYDDLPYDQPSDLMPVGNILHMQLLAIPPPPKRVKGWTLRPVTALATEVQQLAYPLGSSDGSHHASAAASIPLRVSFILSPLVFARLADPLVAWYDGESKTWRKDNITDVQFDGETRQISFLTTHISPVAFVQPRFLDLPWRHWMLQATGLNTCHLTLESSYLKMDIEIKGGRARLVEPALPELAFLRPEGGLATELLLHRMGACGLNIVPTEGAESVVEEVTLKDSSLEEEACFDIALVSAGAALAFSAHNQQQAAHRLVFQLKETATPGEEGGGSLTIKDPDWTLFVYETKNIYNTGQREHDEAPDFKFQPEHMQDHVTLFSAMHIRLSEDGMKRVKDAATEFTESVALILRRLRLFSFAAAGKTASQLAQQVPTAEEAEGNADTPTAAGGEGEGEGEVSGEAAAAEGAIESSA